VSIIAWHGAVVCGGYDYEARVWQGPIGPVVWFLVPSFFALSGFLVMGSLQRNDLLSFLALRGLRIFPALAVELVLSAFIIGGLLTTLPVTAYFTDTRFFDYFGNLIGIVRYELPGVFQTMPTPAVNLQLWTIPYELDCYIVLSCLALLGLHRRPGVLLGLVVGLGVAFALHSAATGDLGARRMPMPGPALVFSFLCGAALYALRDRVPFKGSLFVAALVLSWLSLRSLEFHYAAALPVAYVTIYLGLLGAMYFAPPCRNIVFLGAACYFSFLNAVVIHNHLHQGNALNQRQVVSLHGLHHQVADPGITKNHFHQQRRAEQEAELHADHCDGGKCGVLEDMTPEDAALGQAAQPRDLDIGLVGGFDQA